MAEQRRAERAAAVAEGHPDLSLQALERITDANLLRAIADNRSAPKGVRQHARALLARLEEGLEGLG